LDLSLTLMLLLAYGSATLVEEMILRFPNHPSDRGTWMRSMMKLGQMLIQLGLLNSLLHSPEFDRLSWMASNTDKHFGLFSGSVRDVDALTMMLGLGPFVPWHSLYGLPFPVGWHAGPGASARDLLSVFLGNPTVLTGEHASQAEATMIVAFVLLSSMLIVSAGQTSLAPIDGTMISGVLRQDLVRDAIVWMDSQMPSYLFHRDIEKYIRDASRLRYGARPDESMGVQTTA